MPKTDARGCLDGISVIMPCLNEGESVARLVPAIRELLPTAEIIVVDDGSSPPITSPDARIIRHVYRMGNGAAVKTGTRNASGSTLVFMDADGQHQPTDIPRLLDMYSTGYAMVVGARAPNSQATLGRRLANTVYNRLASWMTGYRIDDLTSGFRVVDARKFRNFLYLLPNSFSYPSTITMAFFRSGHAVGYVPIRAQSRSGKSKIRLTKDGVRFLIIILKIGTLFSPMRFFLPISLGLFALATAYYGYTYATMHRFTNMSAVIYLSSLFTFLFGIVSEQISMLHYRYSEERRRASDSSQETAAESGRSASPH